MEAVVEDVPFIIPSSLYLCWCCLSMIVNLLEKKCLLPCKDFETHSAYINKFGCVYSVSLLITWIQRYFQDETSHKFVLTSKEAICLGRKCVHIMFYRPLNISEGFLPTKTWGGGGSVIKDFCHPLFHWWKKVFLLTSHVFMPWIEIQIW